MMWKFLRAKFAQLKQFKPKRVVNFVLVLLIIVALITLVVTFPVSGADDVPSITFTNIIPESGTIYESYVDIGGAVANPGLYKLSGPTRVGELVTTAGGFTSEADAGFIAEKVNLAKLLHDEDKVFIPFKSVAKVSSSQSSTGKLISLNNASSSELETLPGVGAATAAKIIAARPFAEITDLQEVSGVGESKFNQLKDLVSL